MGDAGYPVQLGLWTNWSYGPVLGKTLTVSRSNGALIIAFLAFFVTIVGSHVWHIVCFLLHHAHSAPHAPRDALHHQRQAVLRNSSSPVRGLLEMGQLAVAWRGRKSVLARLLPGLVCAALTACALILASGFSSRVSLRNDVLLAGDMCGLVTDANATMEEYFQKIRPLQTLNSEAASNYAQRCYGTDGGSGAPGTPGSQLGGSASNCGTLVRASLPVTVDRSASCPFSDSLCLSKDANVFLDSGMIDSLDDLGINSAPKSRFQYRQTLHCAPLVTEGYRSNITDRFDRTFTRYMYGPMLIPNPKLNCNCTIAVPSDALRPGRKTLAEARGMEYTLDGLNAAYAAGSLNVPMSSFAPIPEFNRTDIELHLVSLSPNAVAFLQESSDLWYRATSPIRVKASAAAGNASVQRAQFWEAEEPLWPMGCASQYQLCNPSLAGDEAERCTELASWNDALVQAEELFGGDPGQLMSWFMQMGDQASGLSVLLGNLGVSALTSRLSLTGDNMQAYLEPNQWQLDVINWFHISLAYLQLQVVNAAAGPARTNPSIDNLVVKPQSKDQARMCQNQKIRSTEYTSFSFFGILFIFIFGFTAILLSLVIESLASWLQRRFKLDPYRKLEWEANHKLQLQRLAHQGLLEGESPTWTLGFSDVPLPTDPAEKLAVLDVEGFREGQPINLKRSTTMDSVSETGDSKSSWEDKPTTEHIEVVREKRSDSDISIEPVTKQGGMDIMGSKETEVYGRRYEDLETPTEEKSK